MGGQRRCGGGGRGGGLVTFTVFDNRRQNISFSFVAALKESHYSEQCLERFYAIDLDHILSWNNFVILICTFYLFSRLAGGRDKYGITVN